MFLRSRDYKQLAFVNKNRKIVYIFFFVRMCGTITTSCWIYCHEMNTCRILHSFKCEYISAFVFDCKFFKHIRFNFSVWMMMLDVKSGFRSIQDKYHNKNTNKWKQQEAKNRSRNKYIFEWTHNSCAHSIDEF